MKRRAPDWEKILAKYIPDKGLSCRIYKELSLLHNQPTTDHPKWSKDLKRHFTKTKHNLVSSDIHKHPYIQFLSELVAKKGHEKILSIIHFTLYRHLLSRPGKVSTLNYIVDFSIWKLFIEIGHETTLPHTNSLDLQIQ